MRLEFTYTADDFAEMQTVAQLEAYAKQQASTTQKRAQLFGWVFFIGLAVLFFLMLQERSGARVPVLPQPTPGGGKTVLQYVVPYLPWLLVFGFIWFFVYRQMKASAQALTKRAESEQPKVMDITHDGITLADTLTSMNWRWESFTKRLETKGLILLSEAAVESYVMIPKRAVPESGLDELRRLLAAKIHQPGAFPVLPASPSAGRGDNIA